jgi:hypothetical protein
MSDSGANEDELIKQKLSGVMAEAGVTPTDETIQAMYEYVKKTKSMKSTKASTKAPSLPSAMQEVKSLPKMHVESQPKVDSPQEGSDKKSESEQVEHAVAEEQATLESLPPSTVKEEPIPPKVLMSTILIPIQKRTT